MSVVQAVFSFRGGHEVGMPNEGVVAVRMARE